MHPTAVNLSSPFDHFYYELDDLRVTFIILQSIIGGVTVLGSSVVLALFYNTRKKAEGSARKYFIALAVSDFQGGIFLTTIFLYAATGVRVNDPFCIESIAAMTYSLLVTLFLMVTMTIDRYFAILYPLKHKMYSSNRVTNCVIVGCWISGAIIGSCCYLTQNERSSHPGVLCFVTKERVNDYFSAFCFLFIIFPSIAVFLFAYAKMFKVIRTSVRIELIESFPKITPVLLQMQTNSSKGTLKSLGNIVIRRNTRDKHGSETTFKGISVREVRATLILFLSIFLFLLMWVPGPIGYVIYAYFPEHGTLNLGISVVLLFQLNSMVNPFLYARSIKDADKIGINWVRSCLCIGNT